MYLAIATTVSIIAVLSRMAFLLKSSIIRNPTTMVKSARFITTVEIKSILRTADAVCFDVDSTVIAEEGIDELAAFKGKGQAVADWTAKAMGGQVLFQDALAARLDIIQPSFDDIKTFLEKYPPNLTSGIKELVEQLHNSGKNVYLVSGGFRQMIEPVAEVLNIPFNRIYANNILFHQNGSYKGFDAEELTSKDGGKPTVVQLLKDAHGYQTVVMVGDGVTDMQARPPASAFIGFGGVVVREPVQKGADLFVTDFKDITKLLKE